MQMYAEEGDIQRTIQTAIRVAAYQYADYTEMSVGFLPPCLSQLVTRSDMVNSILVLSRGVSFNSGSHTGMRR